MGLHKNLRSSVIAFLQDFITDHVHISPACQFVDFDAPEYQDRTKLPPTDLVGMKGFSWQDNDGLAVVSVMLAVSTLDDLNLFRHTDLVDELVTTVLPERKIPVVNADTGVEIGWMVVQMGTDVMPITPSDIRSAQLIAVELLTDQSTR